MAVLQDLGDRSLKGTFISAFIGSQTLISAPNYPQDMGIGSVLPNPYAHPEPMFEHGAWY